MHSLSLLVILAGTIGWTILAADDLNKEIDLEVANKDYRQSQDRVTELKAEQAATAHNVPRRKGIGALFVSRVDPLTYHVTWHKTASLESCYFVDRRRFLNTAIQIQFKSPKYCGEPELNLTMGDSGAYKIQIYPTSSERSVVVQKSEWAKYNFKAAGFKDNDSFVAMKCDKDSDYFMKVKKPINLIREEGTKLLNSKGCSAIHYNILYSNSSSSIQDIVYISPPTLSNVSVKFTPSELRIEHNGRDIYNLFVRNLVTNGQSMRSGNRTGKFDMDTLATPLDAKVNVLTFMVILQRTVVLYGDRVVNGDNVKFYYLHFPTKIQNSDVELTKQWFSREISDVIVGGPDRFDVMCTQKTGVDTTSYQFDGCQLVKTSKNVRQFSFDPESLKTFNPAEQ